MPCSSDEWTERVFEEQEERLARDEKISDLADELDCSFEDAEKAFDTKQSDQELEKELDRQEEFLHRCEAGEF
jgi:nucleoid-associated protein YejK